MSQTMAVKRLQVKGMTCTGCETRIEGALHALPGVKKARAQVKNGSVEITYDADKASMEAIVKAIEAQGYTVEKSEKQEAKKPGTIRVIGLVALMLVFVLMGSHYGWFQVFNFFPLATEDTGYGMLFVIGLLTSVHCVAMCGGINLSQCISKAGGQGRFAGFMPSLLYNLGRVISYTVIGGIVGAVGSVVQFSGTARGIVQLLAGVFMVLMGLSLSGLVPSLARFTPHLPKALGRKIAKEKKRSNSPLYVGLLNGLMPCGPLQAMQLYALSTGSVFGGALSMLLFSLGTVPLMFALGALSSILSRKFTKRMVMVGAVLVAFMGISMFQNGLALSGAGSISGAAQSEPARVEEKAVQTQQPDSSAQSSVQEITSQLTGYGYPAITVKEGIPVKWTIKAAKGSINGCNYKLYIPEYKIEKTLVVGDNVIEFTPTRTGTFNYSCWMGMIRSNIKVVKNEDAVLSEEEKAVPTRQPPAVTQAPALGESVQEITSTLSGYGYPAITVQAGVPVKWTIKAAKGSLNGCNYALVIPEYKIEKRLEIGDNVIEFTPTRTGTFTYSCWMGMIRSTIKVTENEDAASSASGGSAGEVTGSPAVDFSDFAGDPEATDDPNALPLLPGGCCN